MKSENFYSILERNNEQITQQIIESMRRDNVSSLAIFIDNVRFGTLNSNTDLQQFVEGMQVRMRAQRAKRNESIAHIIPILPNINNINIEDRAISNPRLPRTFPLIDATNLMVSLGLGGSLFTPRRRSENLFQSNKQITPSETPDLGENHKLLCDMSVDDEEIPEAFLCKLSGAIMSTPVYDPNHPDIKFEKSWIMRSLENKNVNPFTRTPLQSSNLVFDESLKEQIEIFMELKKLENTGKNRITMR